MAVEATHLSLFPPEYTNGEVMKSNAFEEAIITNLYSTHQIGYGLPPLSAATTTTTTSETLLPPMYGSVITDSVTSRKHYINIPLHYFFSNAHNSFIDNRTNCAGGFTFLGQHISSQILQQQQQQLNMDQFISHHTEKVRMEIEKRRKRHSSTIIAAMEEGMTKTLRAKEEEIDKIGKLNWALEEKVKSLCVENQIWRDLAHSNEATVQALRTNLEQALLAQVQDEQRLRNNGNLVETAALIVDDAQSCCGSNFSGGDDIVVSDECTTGTSNSSNGKSSKRSNRWLCKKCGKEESCVLLLPCRHLCLCSVCGSSVHTCPVCKFAKNASLHVKMSY